MKNTLRIALTLVWMTVMHESLHAQDIQFSQFYAVPTYQNPAFAGSAHAARGILHNRLQWLRLNANYKTLFASGDTYLSKYRSGIGIIAMRDWQGDGILNSNQIGFQYSYELPVSSQVTVRAGLEADLVSRSLNYSNLRFPGEFTDTTGYTGPSGRHPTGSQNIIYPDFSSGLVVYTGQAWFGFAAHHLNQPSQSFVGDPNNARLPMQLAFTGGYKFNIQSGYLAYTDDDREISITPTFHYKMQGKSDQLDIGVYGIYDQLLLGAWYRGLPIKQYSPDLPNNEAIILFLGWRVESWSFGYSYDITISRLAQSHTRGAHEFNITYVHHVKKKRKPMKRLPCPSFYKH